MSASSPTFTSSSPQIGHLRVQIVGAVHTPDDPDYDGARRAWNLTVEQSPAVVVEPTSADEVVVALRFARTAGLPVAVQATGHGVTRAADGALLLLTRRLDDVVVDPVARRARIGAGVTWEPVLAAAQEHGLAPLVGSAPHVGAVGYTLGGGMGWIARRHGLAADRVVMVEIATADGELRRVTADSDPDLFWALRGAGVGSFGVVTAMEIELVPVTMVTGGNLLYPVEMAPDVMARFRDWTPDLPDGFTAAVTIMNYPPLEIVPEPVRGRSFVLVRGCHVGDPGDAEGLLADWRDWRVPAIDLFGLMPFTQVAAISQDPVDPVPACVTSERIRELSDDVIDTVIEHTTGAPPPLLFSELRLLGGAIGTGDSAASEALRGASFTLQSVGITPTVDAVRETQERLEAMRSQLRPWSAGGAYLNFLEGGERRARARSAFSGSSWERLRRVKSQVDPTGMMAHGLMV